MLKNRSLCWVCSSFSSHWYLAAQCFFLFFFFFFFFFWDANSLPALPPITVWPTSPSNPVMTSTDHTTGLPGREHKNKRGLHQWSFSWWNGCRSILLHMDTVVVLLLGLKEKSCLSGFEPSTAVSWLQHEPFLNHTHAQPSHLQYALVTHALAF